MKFLSNIIWVIKYLLFNKDKFQEKFLCNKVKLSTLVKGDLKAPFSIATTPRCRGECYSCP